MAAPYCTSRLAQDGARVIKIERPEGDFARGYDRAAGSVSSYFAWLNAGKESCALDLRAPEDAALARAMMEAADVVVENLAPGALERLGFDLAAWRAEKAGRVSCSISGYGRGHSYEQAKAYDLLVQAESGLCAVTGSAEAPGRVGFSVADIACGMQAYAGVLKALLRRGITGEGGHVEVSLFSALAEWMAVPYLQTRAGAEPQRVGVAHPSIAPYGVFRTQDGVDLVLAVQSEREWQALEPRLLGGTDPRFASNVERVAHRDALDELIAARIGAMRAAEAEALLTECGTAHARLRDVASALEHPALRWEQVVTPNGPFEFPEPATGPAERRDRRVPEVGAQTEALRAEFG
ncbi:CaiB/BaiF CoA transferase family protein [Pontivivens ytuae]|uniref:CaiB/BaiF CoA transferase family protein n=1 Tax=Pontivivens ytuae TaxID=2789856 RepID=UPI001E63FE7B|nr:CaiB/BaiF CoA-transferase family protein [Pontivivens ytuae]